MQQLRRTILAEEETIASRSRFGLFSQPPPIALGDNSAFPIKIANKGEDGKPKTEPRQLLAGQNRSGLLKKSFIQVPESIYQKDPYKQTFKQDLQYQNTMHQRSPMHENEFKPTACSRTVTNSAYPYQEQKQYPQKKARRDENGKVKTEPSNVITNPTSKVQTKLFKPLTHIPDPFQRSHQIQKQEKEIWRSKIKHEVMFKSMSHGGTYFSKNKEQYGIDDKTRMIMSQKKSHTYGNYQRVTHDARFKPAIRGHGDPIGRYPQYIKPRQRVQTQGSRTKMKTQVSDEERGDWKHTYNGQSRPTPSISLMVKNIRRYK